MKKCLSIILTAAILLCAAPLAGFTAIDWPELDFSSLFPSAKAAEPVESGVNGQDGSSDNPIKSVSVTFPGKLYQTKGKKRLNLPINMLDVSVEYENGEKEAFRYNDAVNSGLELEQNAIEYEEPDSANDPSPIRTPVPVGDEETINNDWAVGTHRITAYYKGVKTFVDFEVVPYQKEDYPTIPVNEQTKSYQWDSFDVDYGNEDGYRWGYINGSVRFGSISYLFFGGDTIIRMDAVSRQTKVYTLKEFLEEKIGEEIPAEHFDFACDVEEEGEKTARLTFSYFDWENKNIVSYALATTDGIRFSSEKTIRTDAYDDVSYEVRSPYEFVNGYYFDPDSPRYSKDLITWTEIALPDCSGPVPELSKRQRERVDNGFVYFGNFGEYYRYYSFGKGMLINRCFGHCYGGMSDFGCAYLDMNLGLYYTEDFIHFTSFDELPLYEAILIEGTESKDGVAFVRTLVTNRMDGHWTNQKVFSIDADSLKIKKLYDSPYETSYKEGESLITESGKNSFLHYYMMGQDYFFVLGTENGGTLTPKWLPFTIKDNWEAKNQSKSFDVTVILVDKKEVYATDSSFETILHIALPQEIIDAGPVSIELLEDQFIILCSNKIFLCDKEILRESAIEQHDKGDVDGDGKVDPADARLALRAAVGLEDYYPGSTQFLAADVDKNGTIGPDDARVILRVAVGLESF